MKIVLTLLYISNIVLGYLIILILDPPLNNIMLLVLLIITFIVSLNATAVLNRLILYKVNKFEFIKKNHKLTKKSEKEILLLLKNNLLNLKYEELNLENGFCYKKDNLLIIIMQYNEFHYEDYLNLVDSFNKFAFDKCITIIIVKKSSELFKFITNDILDINILFVGIDMENNNINYSIQTNGIGIENNQMLVKKAKKIMELK